MLVAHECGGQENDPKFFLPHAVVSVALSQQN